MQQPKVSVSIYIPQLSKVCEFLLASEELRVTQAAHVRNYLQMQVTVIVKSKLMKPVQGLISLCGAHISAGTLNRLIHEQLKDAVCPRHLSSSGYLWIPAH